MLHDDKYEALDSTCCLVVFDGEFWGMFFRYVAVNMVLEDFIFCVRNECDKEKNSKKGHN